MKDTLRHLFKGGDYESVRASGSDRQRLSGKRLRAECSGQAFRIEMGKQILHLSPDSLSAPQSPDAPCDYLLFDPQLREQGIFAALRLHPGETLAVDHRQAHQKPVFSQPRDAFRRHLQIRHEGQSLVFRDPISELGTYLSVLDDGSQATLADSRSAALSRLMKLYGGRFEPQPPEQSLSVLREVNRQMKTDTCRPFDALGNPGALLEVPGYVDPIIIGDLHGEVDNLLTLLCSNRFLHAMETGKAVLLFLGDAVHCERQDQLEEMASSVVVMDLVLCLKHAFPEQVFFLVGNHDSFSPDVMKGGVPQSLLWQKYLKNLRGEEYVTELEVFYRQSPLVAVSRDFVACHAGPPRKAINRESLVEARQLPDLVHELTWTRLKSTGWQMGYTRSDVRRFRKSLELEDNSQFIVAHYPQSRDETLWLDVGGISNHHVVYSARQDKVAVFTRVGDILLPQLYPVLPMMAFADQAAGSAK